MDAFPDWLKNDLNRNEWKIVDVGCAEGDGSAVLARNFPSCQVTGMDFSESAVKNAKARFPFCNFIVGDATAVIEPTDVIFSSNTLEHLKNPRFILRNFCNSAEKYAVILLPFEDNLGIAEHINIFFRDFFPVLLGKCYLKYYNVIDCAPMQSPYWPGKQILLVYVNPKYLPPEKMTVETIYRNYTYVWEQKSEYLSAKVEEQAKNIGELESAQSELKTKIDALNKEKSVLLNSVTALKKAKQELKYKDDALNEENFKLIQQNNDLQQQNKQILARLQANENAIRQAREFCYELAQTHLLKLVHFISRLKHQGIHGSKDDRKNFRRWFFSRFRHVPDFNHRYNPIFGIIGILDSSAPAGESQNLFSADQSSKFVQHLNAQNAYLSEKISQPETSQAKEIRKIIAERKYKGILVYPHVVYWEPLQTPQHLLRAFTKAGWLCFFCEHPNVSNAFREIEPNLFIVYEADFLQAVKNAPVTVLLTWMGSMAFVGKIRNKTVWYHLMDHLEIFPYFDQESLKMHNKMAKEADTISYVAKPLAKYFPDNAKAVYLPNGCCPDELLNLHKDYVPDDLKKILATGHKIIGYYGYLAEWMDYDMVRAAALARPEYEFVFIGKAISDVSKIEGLPNVHLLGLKPFPARCNRADQDNVALRKMRRYIADLLRIEPFRNRSIITDCLSAGIRCGTKGLEKMFIFAAVPNDRAVFIIFRS
ncbi:MAG TPA: methyltransferase domain-containing protein, partial [Clostridia bacterium]|nr:methyltransferase domain-containing protein [Clostridia bacterium]